MALVFVAVQGPIWSSHVAQAQSSWDAGSIRFDRYATCVDDISLDPRRAYTAASQWRSSAESELEAARAMHCEALALSALEVYSSAAKLLLRITKLSEIKEPEQRADLFAQAGHAFLLADKPERALDAFAAGLDEITLEAVPMSAAALYLGRSRAFAIQEKWREAILELDTVLQGMPHHEGALLERASLYRSSDDLVSAASDLATFMTLWPDRANGLLERGFLRLDARDYAGAKLDFERVVALTPESVEGVRAGVELGKMAYRDESRAP